MSFISKIKERRHAKERELEAKKRSVLAEISRTAIAITGFEVKMDTRLRASVNKAITAKSMGDTAALKQSYIDIRMAMRMKALAMGMSSAINRLKSNLEFSKMAEDMQKSFEKAGELTQANPTIDVSRLDVLYNQALAPISNIADKIEQFNEMNMDSQFDDYNITDEDVEKYINSAINNPGLFQAPPAVYSPAARAFVNADSAQASSGVASIDKMIAELDDLSKKFGEK